jgi:hypothetical protein
MVFIAQIKELKVEVFWNFRRTFRDPTDNRKTRLKNLRK